MADTLGEVVNDLSNGKTHRIGAHYEELIRALISSDFSNAELDIIEDKDDELILEPKGLWVRKGEIKFNKQ